MRSKLFSVTYVSLSQTKGGKPKLKNKVMKIQLSDGSTSNWDETKPVRILLGGMLRGETGTLTGNYEEQIVCEEPRLMLEVSHPFGTDMIFDDYLSQ